MLIEYNTERKDEDIYPSAIEMRQRVAGRNLQKSIANGVIGHDELKYMQDRNRDETKQQKHEEFTIRMAQVSEKVTVARAEQQLNLEYSLRSLERDVDRGTRLARSRIDILTDLEDRIHKMRHHLQEPTLPTVDEEIGTAVRASNKKHVESLFKLCRYCNRKILVELYHKHHDMCIKTHSAEGSSMIKQPIYKVDQDIVTQLTTFKPQPPRKCNVKSVGSTYIQWEWEPPISDGGLAITEYEISYTAKVREFDRKTNKFKVTTYVIDCLKTSHYSLLPPICHHGYKMVCLKSGSEYKDFKIRCYNLQGYSDWTPMITPEPGPSGYIKPEQYSIYTQEPEPPTAPLYFCQTKVTSSCITLQWGSPFYDGGQDIIDYMISYTPVERHFTAASRDIYIERPLSYLVGSGSATSTTIRNILPDTKVVKISVKAINKANLVSAPANLPDAELRTTDACRYSQVEREIHKTTMTSNEFIDTDFYAGIQQRLRRIDFMRMLTIELKTISQDPTELLEAKEWAAVKVERENKIKQDAADEKQRRIDAGIDVEDSDEDEGNDDGTVHKVEFTHNNRRHHFKQKIETCEAYLKELKVEKARIDSDRGVLTKFMQAKQIKQMTLKQESDRVKNYKGVNCTSDVLIGASMQYKTQDLLVKITHAYDYCSKEISGAKYKVISGENRKAVIKAELVRYEGLLKDRRAAFVQFEADHRRKKKVLQSISVDKDDSEVLIDAFRLWIEYNEYVRSFKDRVTGMFNELIMRYKQSAFEKWKYGEFSLMNRTSDTLLGTGSMLLQKVQEGRLNLQSDLRELIAVTNNINSGIVLAELNSENRNKIVRSDHFRSQEEGMDHHKLANSGMHFLYEGEGYASVGNFVMALAMFEGQIALIRSKPNVNIKWLAMVHGRMGKMFLKQSRFDRAIVDFDRQLSLAIECNDKVEQADAYLGIGTGYLMRYGYDDAINYLTKASSRYTALGNINKYLKTITYIRDCYERQGKTDKVEQYDDKISHIKGQTERTLYDINERLHTLSERLRNTSAGIEMSVPIERMTYKAMHLKHYLDDKHKELDSLEDELQEQEEAYQDQLDLLNAIETELLDANESDESEMMSNYVHDQPQVVEIEELKTRLAVRINKEKIAMKAEQEKINRIVSRIKNTNDDINEGDDNLDLEQGALMTHVRIDKPFRCVSLCQGNAAGNDVTGQGSGGVENFIAAEGISVHVIDYTGGLLNIMVGDDKHRVGDKLGHTGVVTSLLHDGIYYFSGSADETIICWDAVTYKIINIMTGHEGSVIALAAEAMLLASGSADATIRIWDKLEGKQLRLIHGHSRSVLSIDMGSTWMLTGSADEEVRLWNIKVKSVHTVDVTCKKRLLGHETGVTCVKYSAMEIFTGDSIGRIFIWWMETFTIMRMCQVHTSPVRCMQFDAVHVISGGTDCAVAILDVATGEVVQSLRGHTGHILGVAFDAERIVSVSGDNTIRYWKWGKKETIANKVHVLNKGETLLNVSKLYKLPIPELMKWNGIKDVNSCYEGMKLVVKKVDPLQLTDAEKDWEERERRNKEASSITAKKMKDLVISGKPKYDRVQRIANDLDHHSLGNRMFGDEKKRDDIMPEKIDPNRDGNSLGSRLSRDKNQIAGKKPNRARYYMSKANIEEWGEISDQVIVAMIQLYIEYDCYDIVKEVRRMSRDTGSVIGRINTRQKYEESHGTIGEYPQRFVKRERHFFMPEERKEMRRQKRELKRKERESQKRQHHADGDDADDDIEVINPIDEEDLKMSSREQLKLPPI